MNTDLINNINEIDLEQYKNFFEEIKNKDYEINTLKNQIENIKKDKNNLELYFEQNHILCNDNIENIINENDNENNYDNPEKKYILIKNYYDKFLEIINDKLIENIEQNMILKCNIKEITELNKNNIDRLENLNKQLENYKKNENFEEHDCEYDNINEQIKHIQNTIKENLMLKTEIHNTYDKNMNKKKILKQILLSLLGDKRENSNKLIKILKDKEKLIEINKEFQKKIDTYLKIQKKKDNDINIVQRQVEMLRAQLKEKEKKILELKKNNNNNYNYNRKNNSNSKNKNNSNINLYYIKKNKNELNNYINKGKRSISCIRNFSNINNIYNKKLKKNETKKDEKKQNTFIYCYDASNDEQSITNNIQKKSSNKDSTKKIENTSNKKRNNNNKYKSKSEEMKQENKNYNNYINENNNNNNLFKKIMFNNKDEKLRVNTINIMEDEIGFKKLICRNDNTLNNKYTNESNYKINNNNYNVLLIKYNKNNSDRNDNFIIKKENPKFIIDNTRNNKKSLNLSQKRYEKFMNNHYYNNSHNNNNNKEDNYIVNISKKINTQMNKKLSLNEARYEKKMKNEKNNEKQRDLSVELNHANAEYFINSFKGMQLNQNNNEYLEKSNSNNFKVNNILTQDSQIMNNINIINNLKDKNKNNINNQNKSINMDIKCQIETKENDTTNFKTDQSKIFKTDQSKILKTDDIYQDLVNSLKNGPFNKYKHK